MHIEYPKKYSYHLDRDMECAVYGHAGKLCLVFPPMDGRFYDFPNYGMVETVAPWIEEGRLRLVSVDGIDSESWTRYDADPRQRIEQQERWFHYVTEELLPDFLPWGEKAMVTGCSMGGLHASIFFFRRPDLFDTLLSLSGLTSASFFFHDYMDDLVYANSPAHFLPNMPDDHPWLDLYRQSRIIFCLGQGAWEDEMRADLDAIEPTLRAKGIPYWADRWGYDVNHDWPWWKKMLPYHMEKLL